MFSKPRFVFSQSPFALAYFILIFFLLFTPSPAKGAGETKTLTELIGWSVPGFESVTVIGVVIDKDGASGTLPVGNRKIGVIVFKIPGKTTGGCILNFGTIGMGDLIPLFKGTPFGELAVEKASLLVIPSGVTLAVKDIPSPVANLLVPQGGSLPSSTSFPSGLALSGMTQFLGETRNLLINLGVSEKLQLPLRGNFDLGVLRNLSGQGIAKTVADKIINDLNLVLPLPEFTPSWKPPFLDISHPVLFFKGAEGRVGVGVRADFGVTLASTRLVFPGTTISFDPAKKIFQLDSPEINPGRGLNFNLAGVAVQPGPLSLKASFGEGLGLINLAFPATVGRVTEKFLLTVTGTKTPAEVSLGVDGTIRLESLLGWSIPGLEGTAVAAVQISPDCTSGRITLGGKNASLALFKGAGQPKYNAVFAFEDIGFTDLVPALQGTPADDLLLRKPAFIMSPTGNDGAVENLPPVVRQLTGLSKLGLKSGLNLFGQTELKGVAKGLLSQMGGSSSNLPLGGTMDPSVLFGGQGQSIAGAIINAIDIRVPITINRIPGIPPFIVFHDLFFHLFGKNGSLFGTVGGGANVTLGDKTYEFDLAIGGDEVNGGKTLAIDGTFAGKIEKLFGLPWFTLREVGLRLRLGTTKDIAVFGKTDLGSIKNLVATMFFIMDGETIRDTGVRLTGADIPLQSLPGLERLAIFDKIKFRDLTVSSRSFGGTLIAKGTPIAFLDNLSAVLFQAGTGWTLAVSRDGFSIGEILPLPDPAREFFKEVKFKKAAFIVGTANIDSDLAALPFAAGEIFKAIFGAQGKVKIKNGCSLVAGIDLGGLRGAFQKMNIDPNGLVVQGGLEGLFGGPIGFDFSCDLPPLVLPDTLKFIVLPKKFQSTFFLRLKLLQVAAALVPQAEIGAGLIATTQFRDGAQLIDLITELDFQVDTRGGFSVVFDGKTDKPWREPLGLKGFTLDPGTGLGFNAAVSTEIGLSLAGNTHIGDRLINLAGSLDTVDGAPTGLAAEGRTSELGTNDLMALVGAMVSAAGKEPPKPSFPSFTLKNVDIAFATPGPLGLKYGLDAGGARLGGELWFLLKNQPLASFSGQVTTNGVALAGKIGTFNLGPIQMKNNTLDVKAIIGIPPEPPHFKIGGTVALFGRDCAAEFQANSEIIELRANLDLGALLQFDFDAQMEMPKVGVTLSDLAAIDLSLQTTLKSDLPAWLRGDGKKSVERVFSGITKTLEQAGAGIQKARDDVASLEGRIAQARATLKKETANTGESIKKADSLVKKLKDQVGGIDQEIHSQRGKISNADQTKKIPVAWNWKLKPTKWKTIPDYVARGATEAANAAHRAAIATLEVTKKGVQGSLDIANATLEELRKGVTSDAAIDLDPRVSILIAEKVTADGVLKLAQDACQGLEQGTMAIKAAMETFAKHDVFILKKGLISGSFKKALAGQPVVAGLDFVLLGEESHMGLAFSMTDPLFTANQLEALALYMAQKVLETAVKNNQAPQTLLDLVHAEYAKKAAEVEERLADALKANGL